MWLRTDLVRLDFYICCVGCGKAGVLPRTGLEACGGAPPPQCWVGGGRQGRLTKLTFLSNMWIGSGGARSGHSLSATQLRTDVGRSLQCLTLVDTGEPGSNLGTHTGCSSVSLNCRGVCLSGSSAWLFFVSC